MKKMKKSSFFADRRIFAIFMVMVFAVTLFVVPSSGKNTGKVYAEGEAAIRSGVKIDGIDVSGLSKADALKLMDKKETELAAKEIVIKDATYGDVNTTLGSIGFKLDYETAVENAVKVGNSGDILKRYKENKAIESGKGVDYSTTATINKDKLSSIINSEIGARINEGVETSLVKKDDGTVSVVASGARMNVDLEVMVNEITKLITEQDNKKSFETKLVLKETDNDKTDSLKDITSLLGSYTTDYDSAADRMKNVERAAELIDGKIMYPGDQFSVYYGISPITAENGYYKATVFVGDGTDEDYGGGVCQVATTLYNAVLRAELQIDQRDCHGQPVHYVDLSYDAAIAGGYLDMVFTNSNDSPIYIEAICSGGYITFNIYGKETRPSNRTISFESYVTDIYEPGEDIIEKDESIPIGEEEVSIEPSRGYRAELWKYVYIDGECVESIMINSSVYPATSRHIKRNPKDDGKEATTEEGDKKDSEDSGDDSGESTEESTEETTEETVEPASPADAAGE